MIGNLGVGGDKITKFLELWEVGLIDYFGNPLCSQPSGDLCHQLLIFKLVVEDCETSIS